MSSQASERLWSYPSGVESWTGRTVSLGDNGTQVYGEFEGINGFLRLLSGFDSAIPTPVWQFNEPMLTTRPSVRASGRTDLHAVLVFQSNTNTLIRTPTIYVHRSSSPEALWSYDFPMEVTSQPAALHMSDDGETVIAWVFDTPTNRTRVASFVGTTGALRWTGLVDTWGPPLASVLSSDGTRLAFMGNVACVIVDGQTGTGSGMLTNVSSVAPSGHAASWSGAKVVKARMQRYVELWDRTASGYSFNRMFDLGEGVMPTASALSRDGSTLCVSGMVSGASRTLKVRIFDLTGTSTAPVYSEDVVGAGAYQVWATDAAISDRADVACLGTTGDQAGLVPEGLGYRKGSNGAWERFWDYDLPGSALDIDLAGDGKHLVVGSKSVHAVVMGGGGQVDLFRLGEADLSAQGVPRQGATVQVRLKTTPNAPCALLVSDSFVGPGPGPNPRLQLGRANTRVLVAGTADASGDFVRSLPLTPTTFAMLDDPSTPQNEGADAVQVGRTLYLQGVRLAARVFSDDAVTLTILPQ